MNFVMGHVTDPSKRFPVRKESNARADNAANDGQFGLRQTKLLHRFQKVFYSLPLRYLTNEQNAKDSIPKLNPGRKHSESAP